MIPDKEYRTQIINKKFHVMIIRITYLYLIHPPYHHQINIRKKEKHLLHLHRHKITNKTKIQALPKRHRHKYNYVLFGTAATKVSSTQPLQENTVHSQHDVQLPQQTHAYL